MVIQPVYAYAIHLLAGLAMVGIFVAIYLRVTPFHELRLIREGCVAAALSLAGAVIGFSLTVASSILHNSEFVMFLVWGTSAMVVQLLTYLLAAWAMPSMNTALCANNVAMGSLMGLIALVVGIINAACLS